MSLERTKHRFPVNLLVNLVASFTAHSISKGKPKKLFISAFFIHS